MYIAPIEYTIRTYFLIFLPYNYNVIQRYDYANTLYAYYCMYDPDVIIVRKNLLILNKDIGFYLRHITKKRKK